jgi:hypothetical protein
MQRLIAHYDLENRAWNDLSDSEQDAIIQVCYSYSKGKARCKACGSQSLQHRDTTARIAAHCPIIRNESPLDRERVRRLCTAANRVLRSERTPSDAEKEALRIDLERQRKQNEEQTARVELLNDQVRLLKAQVENLLGYIRVIFSSFLHPCTTPLVPSDSPSPQEKEKDKLNRPYGGVTRNLFAPAHPPPPEQRRAPAVKTEPDDRQHWDAPPTPLYPRLSPPRRQRDPAPHLYRNPYQDPVLDDVSDAVPAEDSEEEEEEDEDTGLDPLHEAKMRLRRQYRDPEDIRKMKVNDIRALVSKNRDLFPDSKAPNGFSCAIGGKRRVTLAQLQEEVIRRIWD